MRLKAQYFQMLTNSIITDSRYIGLWHFPTAPYSWRSGWSEMFSLHSQSLTYIHPLLSYLQNISWERHHKELPVWRDLEAKLRTKHHGYMVCVFLKQNHAVESYTPTGFSSFLLQHIFLSWRLLNQEQCSLFQVQLYYRYPKPILILQKDAQNTMLLAECME